jgi:hypothetical protein
LSATFCHGNALDFGPIYGQSIEPRMMKPATVIRRETKRQRNLKHLRLRDADVTDSGVADLKKVLPALNVER